MKNISIIFLLCTTLLLVSCNNEQKNNGSKKPTLTDQNEPVKNKAIPNQLKQHDFDILQEEENHLSPFIRRIFEDSKGNLWLGTNGDGVMRFNGKSLDYFSVENGFGGIAVRRIVEDKEANLWFATNSGLTKYDGIYFTNYTEKDGLLDNDLWSLTIDNKGILWIGGLQGVCTYDGVKFTTFALPESQIDPNRGVSSNKLVHSMIQDYKGQMWFATNNGAYMHDGRKLRNLSTKNGLAGNAINDIIEDKNHNIWFATHYSGISRFDGIKFTNFTKDSIIKGDEVWSLFEDNDGNIWFPAEHHGVYHYDGTSFTNYGEKNGLTTNAVQSIYQDKSGAIWVGGFKGLFKLDGHSFKSISKSNILSPKI